MEGISGLQAHVPPKNCRDITLLVVVVVVINLFY